MEPRALRRLPTWPQQFRADGERRLLSRGSRLKPAVYAMQGPDGRPVVIKDCAGIPAWSRPLARWLMRREAHLLGLLDGLEGFPQLVARLDRDGYACTVLEGEPLDRPHVAADPRGLAAQLRERVRQMHARGVFHLDLRQRQNLLVSAEGRLQVIDFGAGAAPRGPLRWLLGPALARVDRQAVLKYLARWAPAALTVEEARAYLRARFWRRLWVFSPFRDHGEGAAVRQRLRDG